MNFILTSSFAIVPLIFFATIDYKVSKKSVELEGNLRLSRATSNAWRSISFFLDRHKSLLDFVIQDNSYKELTNSERLAELLKNLKKELGEFADIGVINADGIQEAYEGPYNLKGKNYSEQEWYDATLDGGTYVSDIFLGYRNIPHFVIAIKRKIQNGSFYVFRATLENQFCEILSKIEKGVKDDIFLINRNGIIQTPSRLYGNVLGKTILPVPEYTDNTAVIEINSKDGELLLIGYRYIPNTPFILMVVRPEKTLMDHWNNPRFDLIEYLAISIMIVLLWIIAVTTYMVNRLRVTDERRIRNLKIAESTDKMASIGHLSAGVAHELNNPLSVINEKAGLIQDLIELKAQYKDDKILIKTVNSIVSSVDRCKRITKRLLGFSRKMDSSIQTVDLNILIREVLGFLEKEAEYKSIDIMVDIPENIPDLTNDLGKLQQIFLNIVHNAFAALDTNGKLNISARQKNETKVTVAISDNGRGIKPNDLKKIFDPFFSTKIETGGTGLGLSITQGLVEELGGRIEVESEVSKGTCFIITLPLEGGSENNIFGG